MNKEYIDNLVEKLNNYTKSYDEGRPLISDMEWDTLYYELVSLEKESGYINPDSPSQKISYKVVSELKKVKHNHPMLSLDKTKDEKDVETFLSEIDSIAMAKMDGLTCSLLYENGRLARAETRGNGIIGEDITHNIIFVKGVPTTIPIKDETIIDGEVICTYLDFEEFKDNYKNPRNFASGSIRLLDSKESAKRKLTFVAWDCIKGLNYSVLSEKLIKLKWLGFIIAPFVSGEKLPVHKTIETIKNEAQEKGYPIDGIVFKYENCEYYESLGNTEHHFRGGLAFKFYDDAFSTRLKTIEWTMGRKGQLTPVAIFDPVEIDGTIVERASLHNVSVMRYTLGPCAYVGEPLKVIKANQIIPQIIEAGPQFDYGEVIAQGGVSAHDVIKTCPYCNSEVLIKQDGIAEICYCTNPNCNGKLINKLDHFCGKKGMDIKGLSKATLEKLIDWNWVSNFWDIYNLSLHKNEWIKKPGFGVASVNKILDSIENSRHTELWRVIAAAGIPEIGVTASKVLAKHYKTWEAFRHAVFCGEDFSHLSDFGDVMNHYIHSYDFEIMDDVASHMVFTDEAAAAPVQKQSLEGLQFCITGKIYKWRNRDSLKEYIESLGGKVTGSVTSKTNYLINNNTTSTTAKNTTAKKLNIPIINEEDFMLMVNDASS